MYQLGLVTHCKIFEREIASILPALSSSSHHFGRWHLEMLLNASNDLLELGIVVDMTLTIL